MYRSPLLYTCLQPRGASGITCLDVADVGLQEKILSWVSLEGLNSGKLLARTFVLTLSSFASLTKLPFKNKYTKHKANPVKGFKLDVSGLKIHA